MPKVSKTITHTVDTKPTRAQIKRKFYTSAVNVQSGTYANGNGWYTALGDVSVELYKGIRDLIESIDDDQHPFPFTYSFLQDEEIEMESGGFAPEFSIGNYNFNVSVDLGQADTYIPRVDFAVYPYIGMGSTGPNSAPALISAGFVGLRNYIVNIDQANAWRTHNNIRKTTEDTNEYTFSYTLHMYYNTEYFYLGWQAADQDNIEGMIFFSHLIDREDNDWYYITATPGCFLNDETTTFTPLVPRYLSPTYNVSSIVYIFKDGVDILPISGWSCVTNISGIYNNNNIRLYPDGFAISLGATNTAKENLSVLPIIGANATETEFLINPCACSSERSTSTNITFNGFKDAVNFASKSPKDVYISNPIVFRGAMRFSNQILMASDNIIPDDEYIFNYKNYYCPGSSNLSRISHPFLLEY